MSIVKLLEDQRYGKKIFRNLDIAYPTLKCTSKEHFTNLDDIEVEQNNYLVPVFATRFCKDQGFENLLAAANEDGKIVVLDTSKTSSSTFTSCQGHNNAIFDVTWANGGARLLTASGDHTIKLWQFDGELKKSAVFEYHDGSVRTIACRPFDRNIFATGARDGLLVLWDSRTKNPAGVVKPDNIISYGHFPNTAYSKGLTLRPDSITGLAFQDDNHLFSCSVADSVIKAWDIRKTYTLYKKCPIAKYSLPYSGESSRAGYSDISISPCGLRLYANCIDNNIYAYDLLTYDEKAVAVYRGRQLTSFYIKCCISPDGKYIASGSSDEKGYIWSLANPAYPLVTLQGHTAEVSCMSWASTGDLKMATCSDDGSFKVWRMFPDSDNTDKSLFKGLASKYNNVDMSPNSIRRKKRKRPFSSLFKKNENSESGAEDSENNLESSHQQCSVSQPCKRLNTRVLSPIDVKSPTLNLPNYVVDGTSPHHSCDKNFKKRNADWLTELRKSTPSPGEKAQPPPRRRSQSSTPRARGNLLKFFKKASKQSQSNACDLMSTPDIDRNDTQSPTPT